jgi:peptide/nickel transport system permease protein
MRHGLLRFLLRRVASGLLLVLLVSSAALVLTRLAPGDASLLESTRAVRAAERARTCADCPLLQQYTSWLSRSVRLDLGESVRFRRPVAELLKDRVGKTALLGLSALAIATFLGIPAGVLTGSRRGALSIVARGASLVLLSTPSLVTSLVLLLVAVRTGILPAGGLARVPADAGFTEALVLRLRYLVLPSLALALPIAASLERLQSQAMAEALAEPSILAAFARGVPRRRVVWRHAFRLSLKPVLAIYGIIVASALSGSFAVEIVMSWPGLGDLMYEALKARDVYLVAGCAATGSLFLATGILASDLALAAIDPRIEGQT